MHTEGQKVARIRANYPASGIGFTTSARRRRSEAYAALARAQGITLHTYQVGLKQPLPRRLKAWAMRAEGQTFPKFNANYPAGSTP